MQAFFVYLPNEKIMLTRIVIFFVLNFGALALGGLFTGKGVSSEWYQTLNKAPWTPPGWVFGAAWTLIMVCFSFYMASLLGASKNITLLIGLFALQWILNVSWNPMFFYYQNVFVSLLIISSLTILIGYFMVYYFPILKLKTLLILPYFLWLLIATSLNFFIAVKN